MPPSPKRRKTESNHFAVHGPWLDSSGGFGRFRQHATRPSPDSLQDTAAPTAAHEDLSSAANSPVQSPTEVGDSMYRIMYSSEEEDAPQPADEAVDHIQWENSLFARDGDAVVFNLPADESNHQAMPKTLYTQLQPPQKQEKDIVHTMNRRLRPEMLQGIVVEIVVGVDHNFTPTAPPQTMWSLPVALVCYFSLTLRNAHKRDRHRPLETVRIVLPGDDPSIFGSFVEWMYYGRYTPEVHQSATGDPNVSVDVQAWVLGQRLGCVQFQNYAMKRLHAHHGGDKPSTFSTSDVHYAMTQSPRDSKLRMFFEHLIPAWIVQPERTKGDTADWDNFFQEWPGLRLIAFDAARNVFRGGEPRKELLEPLEMYLCEKVVEVKKSEERKEIDKVVPAKRKAEGENVKEKPEI